MEGEQAMSSFGTLTASLALRTSLMGTLMERSRWSSLVSAAPSLMRSRLASQSQDDSCRESVMRLKIAGALGAMGAVLMTTSRTFVEIVAGECSIG